ncbi:MAG: hypothetical protein Q8Q12_11655 [bacterium]|nr:hypothetical protein [bacterium]
MEQLYLSESQVKDIAGMVVPVWFSRKAQAALAESLLRLTLDNYEQYVRAENVCLVVDGDERSLRIARKVQKALAKGGLAFEVLYLEENRGKHYAVKEGILRLMRNKGIEHFVVRDCDADHFICDLPNLVRSAHRIAVAEKTDRVLVIGRRIDRHRPLGFFRGEMEELCNRVMLDSFTYWLARRGRVFNSQYYAPYGDVPDFKSGYKVYSRGLARRIFMRNPRLLCLQEKDYWRHGAEPIVMVEAVLTGAAIGEMNRTTFDVQPTTTFTESSAMDMHMKTLAWMFCRLGIPLACAEQMFNNHIPRLLLVTDASGRDQLDALKRDTLTFYARHLGQTYSHTMTIPRPRFF